jgi:predicted transcriptional regulator
LESKFSNSKWEILEILKDKSPPFRQTNLEKKSGLSQGRISQIFTELEMSKAIVCIGRKGKSKLYDLSGVSKIAFGKTEEMSS